MNLTGLEPRWEGDLCVAKELGGEFDFTVEVEVQDWDGNPVEQTITVGLPHQCDAWEVVSKAASLGEAYARVTRFIVEAEKVQRVLADMAVES